MERVSNLEMRKLGSNWLGMMDQGSNAVLGKVTEKVQPRYRNGQTWCRSFLYSVFPISSCHISFSSTLFHFFVTKKTRPRALGMSNPMMDLVRGKRHERRGMRGRVSPWRRKRLEVENAWTGEIFDLQRRRKRNGKGQHVKTWNGKSVEEKVNKKGKWAIFFITVRWSRNWTGLR